MSTTLLFVIGCTVFAITTMAALWAGYIAFQRAWVNQNSELATEADEVGTLLTGNLGEQHRPLTTETVAGSPSPLDT